MQDWFDRCVFCDNFCLFAFSLLPSLDLDTSRSLIYSLVKYFNPAGSPQNQINVSIDISYH